MKKNKIIKCVIISMILFSALLGAVNINACGTNQALINIWNKRQDLQKAFPGNAECNSKLTEWAKKYGWKESPTLVDYSPYAEIFNSFSLRIQQLEKKIKTLSVPTEQKTIIQKDELLLKRVENLEKEIKKLSTPKIGKWRKCVAWTSGKIVCDDCAQNLSNEGIGWHYEFYILSKDYKQFMPRECRN